MRAAHAWQFYKKGEDGGEEQMCDLHWHPVIRCYSPKVSRMFLEGASETVNSGARQFHGHHLRIPSVPTEHVVSCRCAWATVDLDHTHPLDSGRAGL